EKSTDDLNTLHAAVSSLQLELKKCREHGSLIQNTMPALDREQNEEGFSVTLKSCSRSGTTINCELNLINHGPQQRLTLVAAPPNSSDSRVIDARGQQLKANGGTIAGISGEYVRFDAPSEIPLPGVVRFRDVPAEVKQLPLVEVSFTGHRDFKVQFRDVKVESTIASR
ncbi:MAG TPA: hypothetical protein VGQ46_18155, partial [Thermoanaerobaculia bacterium]|nr:hypothetical protein [Thermoanaerobaculia bacterium]